MVFTYFIVLFLVLFASVSLAKPDKGCDKFMHRDMKKLFDEFRKIVKDNTALRAAYIRAGFHDCVSTTPRKPDSGCNGSLRFELGNINNVRLVDAVNSIVSTTDRVAPCVPYADAFLLAYTASFAVAGNNALRWDSLVDPNNPRVDSNTGDFSDDQGSVNVPNPLTFDFNELLRFYQDRGMNAEDLVVSTVVGHSLGFIDDPTDGPGPLFPFTPKNDFVSSLYAINLLNKNVTGAGNLEEFFTLPSDDALMLNPEGRTILADLAVGKTFEEFAAQYQKIVPKVVEGNGLGNVWPPQGKKRTSDVFVSFSIKLSKLTGDSMRR